MLNVTLDDVRRAADRVREVLPPTPVVRPPSNLGGAAADLWLKLENLTPVGSFKIRGALNAVASLSDAERRRGVYTASAGNMAQGLAYAARLHDTPVTVVVPDTAPRTKVDAARNLGAEVVSIGRDEWWQALVEHCFPPLKGRTFVHPFADTSVIAGQGTVALELLDQVPGMEHVYTSVGGGGLAAGVGVVLRPRGVRVWGVDVSTAPALSQAFAAGRPVPVAHEPTFIDGMGSPGITSDMWPLLERTVDGCVVVTPAQVATALTTLLCHGRLLAEGAGSAAVSAAIAEHRPGARVAVVSGGCLDTSALFELLSDKQQGVGER